MRKAGTKEGDVVEGLSFQGWSLRRVAFEAEGEEGERDAGLAFESLVFRAFRLAGLDPHNACRERSFGM